MPLRTRRDADNVLSDADFAPGDASAAAMSHGSGAWRPSESWKVWGDGDGEVTRPQVCLLAPGDLGADTVLRIACRGHAGGVAQTITATRATAVAATVWMLVRRGGGSLRLEGNAGARYEKHADTRDTWQRLALATSANSRRWTVVVEAAADSEILVAAARCTAIAEPGKPGEPDVLDEAPTIRSLSVSGRAMRNSSPQSSGTVRLSARRLRDEVALSETTPRSDGRYELLADWVGEREPPLVVEFFAADGQSLSRRELAPSRDGAIKLDLEVPAADRLGSELARILAAITSQLGDLALHELQSGDVPLLAAGSEQPADALEALVHAAALAEQTGADLAVLYALARDSGWRERLTTGHWSQSAMTDTVEAAVADGTVDKDAQARVRNAAGALRAAAVKRIVDNELDGPLLGLATHSAAAQRHIVDRILEHDGPRDELWQALREGPHGTAAGDLEYVLQIGKLAGHDLPLIGELLKRRRAGEDVSAEQLAGNEREQWRDLLKAAAGAGEEKLSRAESREMTARADALALAFERAFPAPAFVQRALRHRSFASVATARFLRAHPSVDLATADLDALAKADDEHAARAPEQIRAIQRLYKISPRFAHVAALHRAGLKSASQIARTGRSAFIRRHADALGGTDEARQVFERAARIAMAATALHADHGPRPRSVAPRVLQATAPPSVPDWEELFGDQLDFAGIHDWRSAFSPAAYLADLMQYLSGVETDAGSALDALFSRRPDLERLALSAANTSVEMSYLDVVNALLETAVLYRQPLAGSEGQTWWIPGYPAAEAAAPTLPGAPTAGAGDEGWQWGSAPPVPDGAPAQFNAHQSPPASGLHQHGISSAAQAMAVQPGDMLAAWVYPDPDNPPDEIMVGWDVGDDQEHRAYWTDLPEANPGIPLGVNGTASQLPIGPLPDAGRWTRLVIPAADVGLDGTQVTGVHFLVYTDPGDDPQHPRQGGVWWGASSNIPHAPPADTVGTAETLATTPQAIAAAAYTPLTTGVYPQQILPFNLGVETSRIALLQLGVPRWQAMETLTPGDRTTVLSSLDVSTEMLGFTPAERQILDGTDGTPEPEHWGMTVDPANRDPWFTELMSAKEFLRRAGLTLDQMRTLPGAVSSYGFGLALADATDPSSLTVLGVGKESSLGAIRRFLRLWRTLGWDHGPLERALDSLGPKDPVEHSPTIGDPLMVTLAQMTRLQTLIGLSPAVTTSLWTAVLDGRGLADPATYPPDGPLTRAQSPYSQLFLSGDTGSVNPAFVLNADGTELATVGADVTIASQAQDIRAALSIDAQDLEQLATSDLIGLPAPSATATLALNLANLSALYRAATLARALQLSVPDFLAARALIGIDPFAAAALRAASDLVLGPDETDALEAQAQTILFAEALGDIRSSGQSLAALEYLLAHVDTPGQSTGPTAAQVATILADLTSALAPMVAAHQPASDPSGALTLSELAALPGIEGAADAVAALNETLVTATSLAAAPEDIATTSGGALAYDASTDQLSFIEGAMTDDQYAALTALSADANYTAAITTLRDNSRAAAVALLAALGQDPALLDMTLGEAAPVDRFALLLEPITRLVQADLGATLVAGKVSAATGIDTALCAQILTEWLHVNGDSAMAALRGLDAGVAVGDPAYDLAHDALTKCLNVSSLISAFNLTRDELAFAFTIGPRHGWLDLDALPVAVADPDFAGWGKLARYVALRNSLSDTTGALLQIFTDADQAVAVTDLPAQLTQALSQTFGWPPGVAVAGAGALGLEYPTDFTDSDALTRIRAIVDLADTVGTDVDWLENVTASAPSASDGLSAWRVLAAHYDKDTWYQIGTPLQDALRERRRDALVGYLCAQPALVLVEDDTQITPDRIYEQLLIDVEMSSARSATRLDVAIESVQLFVHRCQLGLEPGLQLTADQTTEWDWLSQYQSWVAARNAFIYPENYLNPNLRPDVTEIFTAAEKQLLQADLTSDAAEQALLGYLDGLDEIANLEPAAIVRDMSLSEATTTDSTSAEPTTQTLTFGVTHVISRTRSSPHAYYHRVFDPILKWTPWETINVDIDADNLLPGILNGQLYLFWPQFIDTADQSLPTDSKGNPVTQAPTKSRQLTLAWTRMRNGQWAPKQVATDAALDQGADTYPLPLSNLVLRGDNLQTLRFPADAFAIRAYWSNSSQPTGSAWTLELPGTFLFSPASLSVSRKVALTAPVPSGRWDADNPIGTFGGTHYYVLTIVTSDGYESAPSPELVVTTPVLPDLQITVTWNVDPNLPATYRLYHGESAGGENEYFDVQVPAGQTLGGLTQSGPSTPEPSGQGSPPKTGAWQWPTPQSGLSPDFQAFQVAPPDSGLTLGFATAPEGGGWTGSSAKALALVDADTRILASPFQTDATAPPDGSGGFLPLFGLSVELGERSYFVIQDDAPTEVTLPSAAGTSTSQAIATALRPGAATRIRPSTPLAALTAADSNPTASFIPSYHPWVKLMISRLSALGLDGLLDRDVQTVPETLVQPPQTQFSFGKAYSVGPSVSNDPTDAVDFDGAGAYATYNWELFLHFPLAVALGLMNNQRFSEARAWLHYIFDPNDSSNSAAPAKFWQTGGLFNYVLGQEPSVVSELTLLSTGSADAAALSCAQTQVAAWRKDPTDVDRLAQLRRSAYMKAVVMAYLDNLIAWGDSLFAQGTAETITQATQLYVLASDLLGPAPDLGTYGPDIQPYAVADVLQSLGPFGDPVVEIENRLAVWTAPANLPPGFEPAPTATLTPTLYFEVPVNDKLVGYWATVADRLGKIRASLDLQGQPATVPAFGAPVALGALGVAGGPDGGLPSTLPQYRFTTLIAKSLELCNEVKALGAQLLGAIEKRDAEALARIRSSQEVQVLQAARAVKQQQIAEAANAITVLQRSHDVTAARQTYYLSRPFMNDQENLQVDHLQTAAVLQTDSQGFEVLGAALSLIPEFNIGLSGVMASPVATAQFGGQQLSEISAVFSRLFSLLAAVESHRASMSGLMGGFFRRQDDWTFQAGQAGLELEQIAAQIDGAQIRQQIAQTELTNHDLQIANAQTIDAFLTSKFSNTELYEWMIGQVATVYSQTYQLALDMARRAELAYRHELGILPAGLSPASGETGFIAPTYWNSLSKGLLAGEQLAYDLHRMDAAYLENNRREFELTKHVSLALLDPMSLLSLQQTGEGFIELPEQLYDCDYPGHYMRRLKSVAVTMPCVTGPFGGVNCTLTLTQSRTRVTPDLTGGYAYQGPDDPRFDDQLAAAQSIVTSSAQNDSGLFEANLRDERYLPFEGLGAVSRWHVSLPIGTNVLRRESITDVVLHLRYTARDGGPAIAEAATASVADAYDSGVRVVSLRQSMSDRWAQYSSWAATAPADPLAMALALTSDLLPVRAPEDAGIESFRILLVTGDKPPAGTEFTLLSPGAVNSDALGLTPNAALGQLPQGSSPDYDPPRPLGDWTLTFPIALAGLELTDIMIILEWADTGD